MNRPATLAALVAAGRRGAHRAVDFHAHLFEQQRRFVESRRRFKVGLTARRAGKTTAVAAGLLKYIDGKPGRVALYLTLTRKNAKRILWPAVLELLDRLGIGYTVNRTDLEIRLHGGGTLLIGGVDTQEQVERWRGYAYAAVAIDECQSFPSERLRSLIQDVVRPALADYRGPLFLTGTPGPVPAGYWYQLSGPESRHDVHHWTGLDNPHLPDFADELAEIREENGWTEESPTYLREYLGIWVLDYESLVYRYDDARNGVDALPTVTAKGAPIAPSQWRYVLTVDVGEVHATAFVVVAAHPAVPDDYVVHAEKMIDMATDRMAARIVELMEEFPGPVLMDTQGVGKKFADECRSRYGLPIEAADKADKFGGIRIVRDRQQSGRLKAIRGAADPLLDEWRMVVWNRQRNDHQREQEDHCSDAAIYGIKKLRNYTTDHLKPAPERGSKEWHEQQERAMQERYTRPPSRRHRRHLR